MLLQLSYYTEQMILHNGTEQIKLFYHLALMYPWVVPRGSKETNCLCCLSSKAGAPFHKQAAFTDNVKGILSLLWLLECFCSLCLGHKLSMDELPDGRLLWQQESTVYMRRLRLTFLSSISNCFIFFCRCPLILLLLLFPLRSNATRGNCKFGGL